MSSLIRDSQNYSMMIWALFIVCVSFDNTIKIETKKSETTNFTGASYFGWSTEKENFYAKSCRIISTG